MKDQCRKGFPPGTVLGTKIHIYLDQFEEICVCVVFCI